MATGHFIAWLQLALYRDEHFYHLHHARQQFITALQFIDLVVKPRLQSRNSTLKIGNLRFDQLLHIIRFNSNLLPLRFWQFFQHGRINFAASLDAFWPCCNALAIKQFGHTTIETTLQDGAFIVTVFAKTVDFSAVNSQCAFIFFHTPAREHPHLHNGA